MTDDRTNRYLTETCDSCGPQRTWHVTDTKRMLRYIQFQRGKVRCPQCQTPMTKLDEHIVTPPGKWTMLDGTVHKWDGKDYVLKWQQWLPTLRHEVVRTTDYIKWSDSKPDSDREALEASLTRFDSFLQGEFLSAAADNFDLSPLLIYMEMLLNRMGGRWNDCDFMSKPEEYTEEALNRGIFGSVHVYLEDGNTDLPFRGPV